MKLDRRNSWQTLKRSFAPHTDSDLTNMDVLTITSPTSLTTLTHSPTHSPTPIHTPNPNRHFSAPNTPTGALPAFKSLVDVDVSRFAFVPTAAPPPCPRAPTPRLSALFSHWTSARYASPQRKSVRAAWRRRRGARPRWWPRRGAPAAKVALPRTPTPPPAPLPAPAPDPYAQLMALVADLGLDDDAAGALLYMLDET